MTAMDNNPTTESASANRVFVLGRDGEPLAPCCVQRAWKLIKAKRVRKRWYHPDLHAIQLKDRDRSNAVPAELDVRTTPGVKTTGIAVVMKTPTEDRVVYQEEITHRNDISRRLVERKAHRRRRRGQIWFRPKRFDNRARPEGWTRPTIKSIVSNQVHSVLRLLRLTGATSATVQTGKFDTHKILRPGIKGIQYQQGPLYKTHTRAYVAQQWKHRCAYCSAKDWEASRPFNLEHVVPRSAGGATNIHNLVWACEPCNRRKNSTPVEDFLAHDPERLNQIVQTTTGNAVPLARTGLYAEICKRLVTRLKATGTQVDETTGADTANARKLFGVRKSAANDAACCGATEPVTRLRHPLRLKATGHGRRKQIKGRHGAEYMAWRHLPPSERKRTPCPKHAVRPNIVNGIRTGDTAEILHEKQWVRGRAQVVASKSRVYVKTTAAKRSTENPAKMRRIAPRNGYQKSN